LESEPSLIGTLIGLLIFGGLSFIGFYFGIRAFLTERFRFFERGGYRVLSGWPRKLFAPATILGALLPFWAFIVILIGDEAVKSLMDHVGGNIFLGFIISTLVGIVTASVLILFFGVPDGQLISDDLHTRLTQTPQKMLAMLDKSDIWKQPIEKIVDKVSNIYFKYHFQDDEALIALVEDNLIRVYDLKEGKRLFDLFLEQYTEMEI